MAIAPPAMAITPRFMLSSSNPAGQPEIAENESGACSLDIGFAGSTNAPALEISAFSRG
jgi:hypothetical protein